jgi:hypothetical protein
MTALSAAREQARDAREQVARRLEQAAFELTRQAAATRLGGRPNMRRCGNDLAAVSELVALMTAHELNTARLARGAA